MVRDCGSSCTSTHLEEHDDDQADDTAAPLQRSDGANESATSERVDGKQERGGDEGEQSGTDESTDSEDNETVGKHLRSLGVGVTTVLVGVVEEEGSDGDLGSDVHELGDESSENSDVGGLLGFDVASGSEDLGSLGTGRVKLLGLGKLGEEVGNSDDYSEDGDGQVDVLNVVVGVLDILTKEVLGGDQGTKPGRNRGLVTGRMLIDF